MRIIKTSDDVQYEKTLREIANFGCEVCPCCGETTTSGEAIKQGYGLKRGISLCCVSIPIKTGLFKTEMRSITKYSCNTCGAEWESEPY